MYNAPAVSFPVGRSHIKRAVTGGLVFLSLAVLIVWCQPLSRLGWPQALGGGLWLLAALLAVRDDARASSGQLIWDGQHWCWESGGQSLLVHVCPRLDGQGFMLLALKSSQQDVIWLWLERKMDALNWDALRRAVWGAAPSDAAMAVEDRPHGGAAAT